eukprot:417756_1
MASMNLLIFIWFGHELVLLEPTQMDQLFHISQYWNKHLIMSVKITMFPMAFIIFITYCCLDTINDKISHFNLYEWTGQQASDIFCLVFWSIVLLFSVPVISFSLALYVVLMAIPFQPLAIPIYFFIILPALYLLYIFVGYGGLMIGFIGLWINCADECFKQWNKSFVKQYENGKKTKIWLKHQFLVKKECIKYKQCCQKFAMDRYDNLLQIMKEHGIVAIIIQYLDDLEHLYMDENILTDKNTIIRSYNIDYNMLSFDS